jgi:hypothetical protein
MPVHARIDRTHQQSALASITADTCAGADRALITECHLAFGPISRGSPTMRCLLMANSPWLICAEPSVLALPATRTALHGAGAAFSSPPMARIGRFRRGGGSPQDGPQDLVAEAPAGSAVGALTWARISLGVFPASPMRSRVSPSRG